MTTLTPPSHNRNVPSVPTTNVGVDAQTVAFPCGANGWAPRTVNTPAAAHANVFPTAETFTTDARSVRPRALPQPEDAPMHPLTEFLVAIVGLAALLVVAGWPLVL